jgi:hypothetical protein
MARNRFWFAVASAVLAGACLRTQEITVLERKQGVPEFVPPPVTAAAGGASGSASASTSDKPSPRRSTPPSPAPPPWASCRNGGYCRQLSAPIMTGLDLLFVIDNSESMAAAQAALRDDFPRMIRILTAGRRDDGSTFLPARDIHLGVVTTDMGTVGVRDSFPGCNGDRAFYGGDDGLLQHRGSDAAGCDSSYPSFLEYIEGGDPQKLARDFACMNDLGTSGCGFEQPLEAALKALWPETYVDEIGRSLSRENNPVKFLAVTDEDSYGHGSTSPVAGGSGGFARNEAANGVSLLAIIVVTDEDDCSAADTDLFRSASDPADPLSEQPMSLRCMSNKASLYPVERYVNALQLLRPNHPDSILLGVIAGVPADLIPSEGVNYDDDSHRAAIYAGISADDRMRERIVSDGTTESRRLAPSCSRTDPSGVKTEATPPRRLVDLARQFGGNGRVQSICRSVLTPAIDGMIDMVAQDPHEFCVPKPLAARDGKVDCDVVVDLPPAAAELGDVAPCDTPFLKAVDGEPPRISFGVRCSYVQVAAKDGQPAEGQGFYYDDSAAAAATCQSGQRIVLTRGAEQPENAHVFLDCRAGAVR